MKIVIADIEEGPLKEAEGELAGRGAEAMGVVTDVSDGASVLALRDRALDRFGAVHLVHNNAGVGLGGPIWDFSEEDWRWILGANQWGVIHGISTFVPRMIEQGEGHVVNTASIAGADHHGLPRPLPRDQVRRLRHVGGPLQGSPGGRRARALLGALPRLRPDPIAESDRNRPAWAPERDVRERQKLRGVIQGIVDSGIAPPRSPTASSTPSAPTPSTSSRTPS